MKFLLMICACFGMVLAALISVVVTALTVSVGLTGTADEDQFAGLDNQGDVLGAERGTLFHFIQISDIHVSIFRDAARIPDLWTFCDENVKSIDPEIVVASGDLTDATEQRPMGSQQYQEEWRQYSIVLDKCKKYTSTWLDIRGNHDTFGVPSDNSPKNYFRNYSSQGRSTSRSYMHTVKKGNYTVSFIAVDGTVEPGAKKMLNFFGVVGTDEFSRLEEMKRIASSGNATFWFGHYPTSTLLAPSPGMRELMKDGIAYLCGHLHTFFMMVPKMHTIHHSGLMELEVGDWKDHRIYRILALDNGLFSFVDLHLNDWPAILITNPKESMYMQGSKEPLHKVKTSTHIRMLIFSPSQVTKCEWRIDGGRLQPCQSKDGKLFVAEWNPSLYAQGMHKLEVTATNAAMQTRTREITFSLDGSREDFTFGGRFTLMSDAVTAAQALFGVIFAILVLPLCTFRLLHHRILAGTMVKPRITWWCCGSCIKSLWVLSVTDRLFYSMLGATLYLLIGPLLIGELTEGQYGVMFLWGTIIGNVFQPGSMSYFYGFTHLLLFVLPLLLIIAHRASLRMSVLEGSRPKPSRVMMAVKTIPFFILIGFQVMQTSILYIANGAGAMVLSPLRLWSIVFAVAMIVVADNLKTPHLANASQVWGNTPSVDTESSKSEEEFDQ